MPRALKVKREEFKAVFIFSRVAIRQRNIVDFRIKMTHDLTTFPYVESFHTNLAALHDFERCRVLFGRDAGTAGQVDGDGEFGHGGF